MKIYIDIDLMLFSKENHINADVVNVRRICMEGASRFSDLVTVSGSKVEGLIN